MFSRTTTRSMSAGPFPLIGVSTPGIEPDRAEVDVLVELEAEPQQDPLLEHARGDVGMADRAQVEGVAAAELGQDRVGQDLAGLQVALAPQVEGDECHSGNRRGPAAAASTARPSRTTSGPTPSPAITPIVAKVASAVASLSTGKSRPNRPSPGAGRPGTRRDRRVTILGEGRAAQAAAGGWIDRAAAPAGVRGDRRAVLGENYVDNWPVVPIIFLQESTCGTLRFLSPGPSPIVLRPFARASR